MSTAVTKMNCGYITVATELSAVKFEIMGWSVGMWSREGATGTGFKWPRRFGTTVSNRTVAITIKTVVVVVVSIRLDWMVKKLTEWLESSFMIRSLHLQLLSDHYELLI